jgi:hypothetical protein
VNRMKCAALRFGKRASGLVLNPPIDCDGAVLLASGDGGGL